MTTKGPRTRALAMAAGSLALLGCEEVEQLQDRFRDLTPHERYEASLAEAGLAETALGRDWVAASRVALDEPIPVSPPFHEQGFITAEEPGAMGYLVSVDRGQRLVAEVELAGEDDTRVFIDLFRLAADEGDPARPLLSTDSVPGTFVHEPWRGGDFVLRLQPELLRGGQYTVTLRLEAQFAFPVQGHGVGSIQSRFGVARDGGRRQHHGVDIFAPRGTPVVAAADGVVSRVQVTGLGGKVVWLRDPARSASLYYAHLDSQAVRSGQQVRAGDVLGFVGNTGNARSTPPHLHFGLYRRGEGPIDPYPFVRAPAGALEALDVDVAQLGAWVRLRDGGIRLRAAPGTRAAVVGELGRHTPLRVLGGSGEYFRVRLPDGRAGYVAARLTEPADRPLDSRVAVAGTRVLLSPRADAPVVATLERGGELPVLGAFEGYLYVRAPTGQIGWMGADSPD